MKVGTFGHTLVDAHIYTKKVDGSMEEYDHIPGLKEQLTRETESLPELKIDPSIKTLDDVMDLISKEQFSKIHTDLPNSIYKEFI